MHDNVKFWVFYLWLYKSLIDNLEYERKLIKGKLLTCENDTTNNWHQIYLRIRHQNKLELIFLNNMKRLIVNFPQLKEKGTLEN